LDPGDAGSRTHGDFQRQEVVMADVHKSIDITASRQRVRDLEQLAEG
jgi:hypothetical protein